MKQVRYSEKNKGIFCPKIILHGLLWSQCEITTLTKPNGTHKNNFNGLLSGKGFSDTYFAILIPVGFIGNTLSFLVSRFITARIRRMGKVIVSVCLSVHIPGGTYFDQGVPTYLGRGVPTLARGYPSWLGQHREYLLRGKAGGMPLAFTQEGCLVSSKKSKVVDCLPTTWMTWLFRCPL